MSPFLSTKHEWMIRYLDFTLIALTARLTYNGRKLLYSKLVISEMPVNKIGPIVYYYFQDEEINKRLLLYLKAMKGRESDISRHEDHYIAIHNNKIVANCRTVTEAFDIIRLGRLKNVLLVRIPPRISELDRDKSQTQKRQIDKGG
jgi:hypothetical protein